MKKHTKQLIAILTLLLIPLLFLSSCAEKTESETLHSLTVKMINAMKAGDHHTAYNLASDACTQEEFDAFYEEFEETFLAITTFELYTHDVSTEEEGGKTYETVQYVLLSEERDLVISASIEVGGETLSGFLVGMPDGNAATLIERSGTVTTLDKSNALQWLLLIVSLLELGFILWAAIDCALHKVESKALWIVLILIGICSLSFSFGDGGFGFGFDINLFFKYTALIGHIEELMTLRVMLPIGAIVYVIRRKKLHTPPAPPPAPVYHSYIPEDEKQDDASE